MNITTAPDMAAVKALLLANNLPVDDLSELAPDDFLYGGTAEKPIGFIGMQLVGDDALLRSLVVTKAGRGRGYGSALVAALEQLAKTKQVKCLYLLTTTAQTFFTNQGYCVIDRSSAPEPIKQTREFSGLCPDDAILMSKNLHEHEL